MRMRVAASIDLSSNVSETVDASSPTSRASSGVPSSTHDLPNSTSALQMSMLSSLFLARDTASLAGLRATGAFAAISLAVSATCSASVFKWSLVLAATSMYASHCDLISAPLVARNKSLAVRRAGLVFLNCVCRSESHLIVATSFSLSPRSLSRACAFTPSLAAHSYSSFTLCTSAMILRAAASLRRSRTVCKDASASLAAAMASSSSPFISCASATRSSTAPSSSFCPFFQKLVCASRVALRAPSASPAFICS
mmetsp:Transcript_145382/g.264576  ORF Transcript_145382/g.264576 Transcript_145382/m.264576 type:complete len:254 (-) Transcript_145382:1343-2104(-)